jgi:hypothetical protein
MVNGSAATASNGSDVLDVDPAGDHLVPKVRDRQRDEREPILALVSDQHSEMLNTRYLRLLQEAADGRLRLAGCTVGVRFASNLGERDFPAPTLGRCMGVPT